MRPGRTARLPLALLAAAAGLLTACVHNPEPAARADLDTLAYGAVAPSPANAHAEDAAYRLDAGDRLRIVVYGQEGLTNTYAVDAGGIVTMPLIGGVPARELTPQELARAVAARLKRGYIREPYVAAEIEAYRPFFILGEVAAPGQYPYVPGMTAEKAVAIAGGFTPRASRGAVDLSRMMPEGAMKAQVPLAMQLRPGDTVTVSERWF
ncbi:MAG: polysaccharide export protein [Xanthobacteraceae bacterium]|nr:MAG: polysaccharide export protein [Xanthobacteraceae bacterium]